MRALPNGDENVNVNAMHFRQRPKTTRSQRKRDAFSLAPGALTKLVPKRLLRSSWYKVYMLVHITYHRGDDRQEQTQQLAHGDDSDNGKNDVPLNSIWLLESVITTTSSPWLETAAKSTSEETLLSRCSVQTHHAACSISPTPKSSACLASPSVYVARMASDCTVHVFVVKPPPKSKKKVLRPKNAKRMGHCRLQNTNKWCSAC